MGFINKNLLVNGGAESGNLTGWVEDPGGWTAATDATHTETSPLGGNEYFFAPDGASGNIHQEVDLIQRGSFNSNDLDSQLLTVVVGGNLEVAGADTGQLIIEYLDVSSGVLGTYKSPLADNEVWVQHKDTRILPSGTRFVSYRFEAIRNIGTQNNAYLDNAFVVLMSGGFGENLVINPGAEEGIDANQGPGLYGWHSNNFTITTAITPRTGSFEFGGGAGSDTEPATPKSMTQSIDITKFNEIEGGLIDGGLLKCTATAFQSSFTDGEDEGSLTIEYLDNASGILDKFVGVFFAPRNAPWVPQIDIKQIPSGTRFIDITVTSERHAGTNNDGYFDDLSVIIESGQITPLNEKLFIEKSTPFVATLDNTWEAMDLTGPPFNVPSGAVVQIAMGNSATSARLLGARTLGSSINRTVDVNAVEADTTNWEMYSMHVQTTSGQIEVLAEVASTTKFILLGYWKRGTYVELRSGTRNTPSANDTWERLNLDSFGVSGTVVEIVCTNDDIIAERNVGIREVGSSLNRARSIHEAEDGNTAYTLHVNASGSNFTIDTFSSDIADTAINIVGYWSDNPAIKYQELQESPPNPSGSNVWEALSFSGLPSGSVVVVENAIRNLVTTNNSTVGVRGIGSTHIRTLGLQEAEAGGAVLTTVMTESTNGQIEIFNDDTVGNTSPIATQGFWSGVVPEIINNQATLFIHNSFVENEITLFVSAPGVPSGEIPLFITGTPSGESTLFIAGKPSGEMSLFLDATPEISGDMPLFIAGKPSGELNLYVGGKPSGEISLFTHGHLSFNAFAKVEDALINDNFGLFIYGGTSSGQFTSDSISFSISGGLLQQEQFSGFAKVGTDVPLTSGEVTWPAFAKVDNTKSNSMGLFINAGPNVDDSMSLFIQDSGTSTSLDGAVPFSGSFSMFARVPSGVIVNVSLFIEGFTFPSDTTDLFMSGSPQIASDSIGLFMSGLFEEISSSTTLVIPSVLGSGDAQTSLFIPGGGC